MQGPPLEPGQWPTPGPDLWSEAAHPQPWPSCRGSSWGSWCINAVLLSWHPLRLRHWCKPDWVVLCPSVTQSLCTLSISFSNTTFPYEQKNAMKIELYLLPIRISALLSAPKSHILPSNTMLAWTNVTYDNMIPKWKLRVSVVELCCCPHCCRKSSKNNPGLN